MRVHRMDYLPRPLAWLPNRVHNFMGVRHDGTQVVCRVELTEDGTYRIADNMRDQLKGWWPMPVGSGSHL